MPPARGKTAPQDPPLNDDDPVIPDSDDDFADDERVHDLPSVEGGSTHRGESHPHRHTDGYPLHKHKGKAIQHDESETYVHGGEAAFDQQRHDADVGAADSLTADAQLIEFETPANVAARVADLLRSEEWTVADPESREDQLGTVVINAARLSGRPVIITVAYNE